MFKATVEFGVEGYHHSEQDFEAPDIDSLIYMIGARHIEFWNTVRDAADKHDGRVVGYCPSFANGVPYFDDDDSVQVTIISLTNKGIGMDWNDPTYKQLRDEFHND